MPDSLTAVPDSVTASLTDLYFTQIWSPTELTAGAFQASGHVEAGTEQKPQLSPQIDQRTGSN